MRHPSVVAFAVAALPLLGGCSSPEPSGPSDPLGAFAVHFTPFTPEKLAELNAVGGTLHLEVPIARAAVFICDAELVPQYLAIADVESVHPLGAASDLPDLTVRVATELDSEPADADIEWFETYGATDLYVTNGLLTADLPLPRVAGLESYDRVVRVGIHGDGYFPL